MEQSTVPKVTSGEATITYSGDVKQVRSRHKAEHAVKRHIEHVFDVEHGDIGYVDILVTEIEPPADGVFGSDGWYQFKAEFTLDEGPASYVYEEESTYLIDQTPHATDSP